MFLNYLKYNKYRTYQKYLDDYRAAENAASGSKFDSNANVVNKNICSFAGEMYKKEGIGFNRYRRTRMIRKLYGIKEAEKYLKSINEHLIYPHDETNPMCPYCVSVSMTPFLWNGLEKIGGISSAPKNLRSFCGSFINLIFILSSQFAGAVATPEFLTYFDYFARKEYGDNYVEKLDEEVFFGAYKRTIRQELYGFFQQVIYSVNQPAAARNFQSVFWNISYFDEYYFNKIFEDFIFPDMTKPNFKSVKELQFIFMEWFRDERKAQSFTLTFPVENACLLDNGVDDFLDENFFVRLTEIWASGHETFFYHSDTVDSLASCCRLRNGFSDNTFSTSLGVGGVATGSKGVLTINFNRQIQKIYRTLNKKEKEAVKKGNYEPFRRDMECLISHVHKWLISWNEVLKEQIELMPIYKANFISLEKQYLTIGVNGFLESAEFLGIDINNQDGEYERYASFMFDILKRKNKEARTKELMFNTELVPAENLGVKHAKWDKEDGYAVPRDVYNSYFYPVESDMNVFDRMKLQGNGFTRNLDGGSAFHCNLPEPLTAIQYQILCKASVAERCNNLTINVPSSICCDCGKKVKGFVKKCPVCGSLKIDYEDRIIGYLKKVSNWNAPRKAEYRRRKFISPVVKGDE